MKIIFFGASRFVLPVIEKLRQQFELCLVVTTEKNLDDAVPEFCLKNNISYISVSKFDDGIIERIKHVGVPVGVLACFGLILPKRILDIFPMGILNIHPSLLPKYRGSLPVQTAILNGDTETGVTIIKLDEEMDHGGILGQEKDIIQSGDTTESLQMRLFEKGGEIVSQMLTDYAKGETKLRKQDEGQATYTKRLLGREDGHVDLSKPIGKEGIERMIRAYYPWPGVWTDIKIHNKNARIKLLPNNQIQMEGKKATSVKDFLNGYPELRDVIERIL